MSQQVIYPHAMAQQPAVLHGEMQSETSAHQPDSQSSLMQDQNSHVVAQLPVTPAETHPSMFPRSMSMPLPTNTIQNQDMADPTSHNSTGMHPFPAGSNSEIRSTTAAKIEYFKNWSISTYKCTKQLISEKLGKSSRTVDTELESQIELLRDVQHKYLNILRLSRALSSHFQHVVVTQVI